MSLLRTGSSSPTTVFTDWLVRGDLAEFGNDVNSVAALVVSESRHEAVSVVRVIPIMVLLVFAHNLIGLSAIIPIALALATFLLFNGSSGCERFSNEW